MTQAITIKRVSPDDWNDFETLFESRGGPKNCWCMVWRPTSTPKSKMNKADRKTAMQACIMSGKPAGLLACIDGKPVAWCSVGPRSLFTNLGGAEDYPDGAQIWAITCFFVTRTARGQGLSDRLIEAAIAYARDCDATDLEAYPVDPESPSYRFMGFVPQFEKHGFKRLGQAGKKRYIYQRSI